MGSSTSAMFGSVLIRTPLSFALRRRARSLCSLKKLAFVSGERCGAREWRNKKVWRLDGDGRRLLAGRGAPKTEMIGLIVIASLCVHCHVCDSWEIEALPDVCLAMGDEG